MNINYELVPVIYYYNYLGWFFSKYIMFNFYFYFIINYGWKIKLNCLNRILLLTSKKVDLHSIKCYVILINFYFTVQSIYIYCIVFILRKIDLLQYKEFQVYYAGSSTIIKKTS